MAACESSELPTPRRDEMSEAALEPEPPVRDVVPDWGVDHLLDGAENRVPGALHAPGAEYVDNVDAVHLELAYHDREHERCDAP